MTQRDALGAFLTEPLDNAGPDAIRLDRCRWIQEPIHRARELLPCNDRRFHEGPALHPARLGDNAKLQDLRALPLPSPGRRGTNGSMMVRRRSLATASMRPRSAGACITNVAQTRNRESCRIVERANICVDHARTLHACRVATPYRGRREMVTSTALRTAAQATDWRRCRGAYGQGRARGGAPWSYVRRDLSGPCANSPPDLGQPLPATIVAGTINCSLQTASCRLIFDSSTPSHVAYRTSADATQLTR